MRKHTQVWTALLLFATFAATAQIRLDQAQVPAVKAFQKAETFMLEKTYEKAIRWYQRSLDLQPGLSAAHRGLGAAYQLLGDYEQAAFHYEYLLAKDPYFSRILYYELAQTHYRSANFNKALGYFTVFQNLQQNDFIEFGANGEVELEVEAKYIAQLPFDVRACRVMLDSTRLASTARVYNLGAQINTAGDEYFPFLSNNQQLLFYTHRDDARSNENLFISAARVDGWSKGEPFRNFNTPADEGRFTMVRNGRKMFFTACNRRDVLGYCDIWEADVDGMIIGSIRPVIGDINTEDWESQVSVSCDGRTLYFASNRPGGQGGTDLWYSTINTDGTWNTPVNLGPEVNTPGNEESPFLTNDGKSLYFSSDGHLGYGEHDIFTSWLQPDGRWSKPINLGLPVNSGHSEFGFFLTADGKKGYLSSDRPGGYGALDLYAFEMEQPLYSEAVTFVEGIVRDSLIDIALPSRVQIEGRDPILTDPYGRFFLCVPAGDTLRITIDKDAYRPYQQEFVIPEWDNKTLYPLDITLNSIYARLGYATAPPRDDKRLKNDRPVNLERDSLPLPPEPAEPVLQPRTYSHTVFFNFDNDQIEVNQQSLIQQFLESLRDKQITRVEIIGFADDIGEDIYNLKLSEERARNIALFLKQLNTKVDQVYIEGKGEIKDDRPKEANRRVEIKIFTLE